MDDIFLSNVELGKLKNNFLLNNLKYFTITWIYFKFLDIIYDKFFNQL